MPPKDYRTPLQTATGVSVVTPGGGPATVGYTNPAFDQQRQFGPKLAEAAKNYPGALQAAREAQMKAYDNSEGIYGEYNERLSQPGKNQMWGRFGAALLQPTSTGSFFEGFGKAANAAMDERDRYNDKEAERMDKLTRSRLALEELHANKPNAQIGAIEDQMKAYKFAGEAGTIQSEIDLGNGPTPKGDDALLADYSANPRKYASPLGQKMIADAQTRASKVAERQWELDKIAYENALKTPTRSPGQQALDKKFGQEVADWYSMGGDADSQKQINQLRGVSSDLSSGKSLSGPITGNTPDWLNSFVNPDAIDTRDRVGEVVQRNLRAILGAQFTQKEGDALISRAYNPALDEATNHKRVNALIKQMEEAYKTKQEAIAYFEQNGTLDGFNKRMPTMGDFELAVENAEATNANAEDRDPKEEVGTYNGQPVLWEDVLETARQTGMTPDDVIRQMNGE